MRLTALFSMLLLAQGAQVLPPAATIQKQIEDAAKQRTSIQYVRELTGEVTMNGKAVTEVQANGRRIPVQSVVGKQTVALENPGKVHIDLQLGAGNLMVSDGESTWNYRPSTKLYSKIAAAQTQEGTAASLAVLDVLGFFADAKSAKTAREEALIVDGNAYDCWVLTTTVKIPAQAAMGGQLSDGVMTSWVDKKSFVEIKEEIAYTVKVPPTAGGAPIDYESKIIQLTRALRVDQPIPANVFVFTPPAGATEQAAQVAGNRTNLSGKDAPAFRGVSLDGKVYTLESLKGRPVLLDFWASWCGPCKKSMPTLEKLHEQYKGKGLVVLGIDVNEKRDTVEKFLKTSPIPYPVIMGDEGGIPAAYGVTAFPTFVMIGADGKVVSHQIGFSESALSGIASSAGLTP